MWITSSTKKSSLNREYIPGEVNTFSLISGRNW